MKNLIKYGFIAVVMCFFSCEFKKDGMIVKDTEGTIYKLQGSWKMGVNYNVIEIDTTDYKAKFK
jgi:hypothetical protein